MRSDRWMRGGFGEAVETDLAWKMLETFKSLQMSKPDHSLGYSKRTIFATTRAFCSARR
jgi:hypothetical protein